MEDPFTPQLLASGSTESAGSTGWALGSLPVGATVRRGLGTGRSIPGPFKQQPLLYKNAQNAKLVVFFFF